MSDLPEADPIPDRPPLHLEGGTVAVVSPESIDEACFSVPAVRALRNARPTATLAILTTASLAPLWQSLGNLDLILEYPDGASVRQITKVLKESGVDWESSLAWDASSAAAALSKVKIPQRLGYNLPSLAKRLTDPLEVDLQPGPVQHRVRYYIGLMEQLAIEGYLPQNFENPPLPPRPNPVRIGLVPGSTFGPAYCWDLQRFRELGKVLLTHHPVELVILAYPGETREANKLDHELGGAAKNFAEQFDLAGLLGALPHCSFLVANDGAVPHLAAHLGVPTVALFGPGDPVARRPLGRQHVILSQHLECSPCNQRRCPLSHHRCLEELTVGRVLEAATAFLQPELLQPHPVAAS